MGFWTTISRGTDRFHRFIRPVAVSMLCLPLLVAPAAGSELMSLGEFVERKIEPITKSDTEFKRKYDVDARVFIYAFMEIVKAVRDGAVSFEDADGKVRELLHDTIGDNELNQDHAALLLFIAEFSTYQGMEKLMEGDFGTTKSLIRLAIPFYEACCGVRIATTNAEAEEIARASTKHLAAEFGLELITDKAFLALCREARFQGEIEPALSAAAVSLAVQLKGARGPAAFDALHQSGLMLSVSTSTDNRADGRSLLALAGHLLLGWPQSQHDPVDINSYLTSVEIAINNSTKEESLELVDIRARLKAIVGDINPMMLETWLDVERYQVALSREGRYFDAWVLIENFLQRKDSQINIVEKWDARASLLSMLRHDSRISRGMELLGKYLAEAAEFGPTDSRIDKRFHVVLGRFYLNAAHIHLEAQGFEQAETLFRQAIDSFDQALAAVGTGGVTDNSFATVIRQFRGHAYRGLMVPLRVRNQPADAVRDAAERAIADYRSAGTDSAAEIAYTRTSLAALLGDPETLKQTADEQVHAEGYLAIGSLQVLGLHASVLEREGRLDEAIDRLRPAVTALRDSGLPLQKGTVTGQFLRLLAAKGDALSAVEMAEAFEAVQLASRRAIATSMQHLVKRLGAGSTRLAEQMRLLQQPLADLEHLETRIRNVMAVREADLLMSQAQAGDQLALQPLIAQYAALRKDIQQTAAGLDKQQRTLLEPTIMPLPDVQAALRDNEAVVAFVSVDDTWTAMAITARRAQVIQLAQSTGEIDRLVAAVQDSLLFENGAPKRAFDHAAAHRLHTLLFQPFAEILSAKDHLFLMLDGSLQSIPLQLLVTELPAPNGRAAVWLGDRFTMSLLPTPEAFLVSAAGRPAGTGFLGVGPAALRDCTPRLDTSWLFLNSERNSSRLALKDLCTLPPPESLFTDIARTVGARDGAKTVLAQDSATKAVFKALEFERYGTIVFWTHGIAADDLVDATEPGLVLTPTAQDDGFLAASEIAGLNLNADLVVLAACNTGVRDRADSNDGLSSLARAFIFAGGRALFVTHWPVLSTTTGTLISEVIETKAAHPGLSWPKALRQASAAMAHGEYPHPAYWAPFSIVGTPNAMR